MLMNYALSRPVKFEDGENYPVGRLPVRKTSGAGDYGWQELDAGITPAIFLEPVNIIGVT